MWTVKSELLSLNNELWSVNYAVWSVNWEVWTCLCWDLTSQSTIFQSCRDGATASWVINQYFRGVKCLAQGHNTAEVGFEPPTSRSGVRQTTSEPPRSPKCELWTVKCELWSLKYEVLSLNYEVWSLKCEVWTVNWSDRVAERLVLPTSDRGVSGSNTAGHEIRS